MSLMDPSSSWIWAMKNGDPIASNSQSADLQVHDARGKFQIDLSKSSGGNSANPFAANATTTSSGAAAANATAGGSDSQGGGDAGPSPTHHMRVIAHGVLMSLAFLYVVVPTMYM